MFSHPDLGTGLQGHTEPEKCPKVFFPHGLYLLLLYNLEVFHYFFHLHSLAESFYLPLFVQGDQAQ